MLKKRIPKNFLTACFVLLGTAALLIRLLPPDRELMNIAAPALSLSRFDRTLISRKGIIYPQPYYADWLNDHEVVLGKLTDTEHWQLMRKTVFPNGSEQPAVPLSAAVLNWGECPIAISHDRHWLLYAVPSKIVGRAMLFGYCDLLQKTKSIILDYRSEGYLWTADGQRIVGFDGPQGKLLFCDPATGASNSIALKTSFPSDTVRALYPNSVSAANRMVMVYNNSYFDRSQVGRTFQSSTATPNIECTFAEVDLNSLDTPMRVWTVPIPGDAAEGYTLFSREGDRILWNIRTRDSSNVDKAMHRLFPKWKIHSYEATHWRVSRLDGSGMRDVAHFRTDSRSPDSYPYPSWLPGGKKLSFIYRDTLYTLPVD